MRRSLLVLLVIAACGGHDDKPAPKEPPPPAAKCGKVPGCIPAVPTGELKCEVGGVAVSCDRCGPNGGLLSCDDTDGDGCVELHRVECGRTACETLTEGLDGARCKDLGERALNLFGVVGPAGFVECHTGDVLPIVGGALTVQIRTRAMTELPIHWSASLKGGGLDASLQQDATDFFELGDEYAVLQDVFHLGTVDHPAKDLELTLRIGGLEVTCGGLSLAPPS